MKIEISRGCLVEGKTALPGDIVECGDAAGQYLIAKGKAVEAGKGAKAKKVPRPKAENRKVSKSEVEAR